MIGRYIEYESIYSIAINRLAHNDAELTTFIDVAAFEPSDTQGTAAVIHSGDVLDGYLHKYDLDIFKIDLR